MPFKTKRQKLSAAERRFTFSQNGAIAYNSTSEKLDLGSESKPPVVRTVKETSSKHIEDIGYVGGDLLKICICALVIIAGQITLHLVYFS